jgi:hypothetical protein
MDAVVFDGAVSSRELLRRLRSGCGAEPRWMPESVAWHLFVELRRRGEPEAAPLFLATLKSLHSRRIIGAAALPVEEVDVDEHRLIDDPFLADLWKAYKKCLRAQRNGPAFALLRDIEEKLCK